VVSRYPQAIGSLLLVFLLGAAPVRKGAIVGKVEPTGVRAVVAARPTGQVARGPLAAALTAADTTTDEEGRYRLEVAPGSYTVIAYAPGLVYGGDDPSGVKVTVRGTQTVQGPDFELVEAAEIRGQIKGLEGPAVVAAIRRSPLPRDKRFNKWARVAMDTDDYRITDLRPGIYDLVFISPTLGVIDGRGYLLGEPGTLDAQDRREIGEVNSAYAKAWAKSRPAEALDVISSSYADSDGGTYDKLKQQYAMLEERRKDYRWQIARFTWKILLIQGDESEAMAVMHQEDQQKVGRSTRPAMGQDFLVHYVKEHGSWKITGIESIREYADLASKISQLVGVRAELPVGYVARYTGDPDLGAILVKPGDISTGHNFDLPALLK
jgi:hypothetical protein